MRGSWKPRVLSERQGRWLLNLFPPFLFGRIRVLEFGPGYRSCRVRIAHSVLTRNLNGTTFGGTVFAAADPIHPFLYWQVLARKGLSVDVWLKASRVEYRRPVAGDLLLDFELRDEDVRAALEALDGAGRFVRTFRTEARDRRGGVCAILENDVYLANPERRAGARDPR